jgi:hypothetical protein
MKSPYKDGKDLMLRKALFLRYGQEAPSKVEPPQHLLSWQVVSNLLKEPYQRIMTAQKQYFGKSKKKMPKNLEKFYDKSRVTCANVTDEELQYITSTEILQKWAPFGIQVRCCFFHRQFPDRRIAPHILTKLMK